MNAAKIGERNPAKWKPVRRKIARQTKNYLTGFASHSSNAAFGWPSGRNPALLGVTSAAIVWLRIGLPQKSGLVVCGIGSFS